MFSSYIIEPEEVDIVGLGKVKADIFLHHEFANLTGRDVAWIRYKHTADVPTVRVAELLPDVIGPNVLVRSNSLALLYIRF